MLVEQQKKKTLAAVTAKFPTQTLVEKSETFFFFFFQPRVTSPEVFEGTVRTAGIDQIISKASDVAIINTFL